MSSYYPLNQEEILKKLLRAISQETANISMNETLINLLQQNKTVKCGGKEEMKRRYHQVRLSMPQEEEQSGPWRLCNNLTESSNGESSDEEDDGTTCQISKIPWIELIVKCGDWVQWDIYMWWIYLPKVLWEERYFHRWFFVVFATDHKY